MIQITEDMLTESAVWEEISAASAGTIDTDNGEISDASARTIASWWPSSVSTGHVLAALANGMEVDVDALLDDISATARQAMGTTHKGWPHELEHLSTWAINHG